MTSQKAGQRDYWADVAKGIAIIGVVLFHAASLAEVGVAHTLWRAVGFALFLFIMPVFFLISGIFAAKHLSLRFPLYLTQRVWPILYLFVAWSAIYAALHLVTSGRLGVTLIASVTLKSTLWFMAAYTLYLIVAWGLNHANIPPLAQVLCAAVLAIPFAIWFPFEAWGLGHTPHFLVAFLIGTNYGPKIMQWNEGVGWRDLAWFAIAALVIGGVAVLYRPAGHVVYAVLPLVAVPAVLIVARLCTRWSWLAPGLAVLGVESLVIYLVHPIVQKAFAWAVDTIGVAGSPAQILYPAIDAVLAIAISVGLVKTVGRVPYIFQAPRLPSSSTRP